jgi:hypothetical protein
MKSFNGLLPCILLGAIMTGPLTADVETLPQAQISLTRGASDTWNADWQGEEHRVYFKQWSLDLVTWNHCPFIKFGSGLHTRGMNSTSTKFFIRLVYYDDPTLDSTAQAEQSDYDGDGLPNLYEVTAPGFDPLVISKFVDHDGDGLNDSYEIFHFGSVALGQPSLDSDGDGLSNSFEAKMAMNPSVGYTLMTLADTEVHVPN